MVIKERIYMTYSFVATKCHQVFSGDQPRQNGAESNVSEALSASIIRLTSFFDDGGREFI
jgi:hypothetical protein